MIFNCSAGFELIAYRSKYNQCRDFMGMRQKLNRINFLPGESSSSMTFVVVHDDGGGRSKARMLKSSQTLFTLVNLNIISSSRARYFLQMIWKKRERKSCSFISSCMLMFSIWRCKKKRSSRKTNFMFAVEWKKGVKEWNEKKVREKLLISCVYVFVYKRKKLLVLHKYTKTTHHQHKHTNIVMGKILQENVVYVFHTKFFNASR